MIFEIEIVFLIKKCEQFFKNIYIYIIHINFNKI